MSRYAGTISGPIAPYNNPPINPQYYEPSQFFIAAITLGQLTTVTTTVNHNYVVDQQCRLLIPASNGCRQLNEVSGYVLSIPAANQVVLSIYSLGGDPFITSTAANQPQILAIGDIANGQINSTGVNSNLTFIPGSFINISPN